jgi:hypothetical protein
VIDACDSKKKKVTENEVRSNRNLKFVAMEVFRHARATSNDILLLYVKPPLWMVI